MNEEQNNQIIQLRKKGMSYTAISKQLGVARSTISYQCKKLLDNDLITQANLPYDPISEDTIEQIKRLLSIRCTHREISIVTGLRVSRIGQITANLESKPMLDTNYEAVKNRRKRIKLIAAIVKGGKCELCGYSKYLSVLEFHHIDPKTKEFSISTNTNRALADVLNEIEKCKLLCANCHRELHAAAINDLIVKDFTH